MAQQGINLKELAAELSLSRTTVSLVLSDKGDRYRIAVETQRRIEDAAERLGYKPNHLARSMRRGKTDTIGVSFPDVSEAYMNRILAGIEEVTLEKGVSMMIATSSLDSEAEARNLEMLLNRRIDGLLVIPYAPFRNEKYSDTAIRKAAGSGVPSVAIDRYLPEITSHAVIGADRDAARTATEKLIAAGCRHPAYLGFDMAITSLNNRRRGFHEAVEAAGLEKSATELLVGERNPESRDIVEWLTKLTDTREFPDGFLVSSDGLAQKLNWLLQKHNPSIGGNSDRGGGRGGGKGKGRPRPGRKPMIARFGEDSLYFPTGMISVHQPHEELGRRAAEMLFSLIAGEVIPKKDQIKILKMKITGENQ